MGDSWRDRIEALLALALRQRLSFLSGAAVTIQNGGSAPGTTVTLDSAAFTLPAGTTRVLMIAFMSVQPTTAGEQIDYKITMDAAPPPNEVKAFGQTGTLVNFLSTNACVATIIAPGDSAAHVYSMSATSAHNLQIGDKTAAIVLVPLP
jgi:hypothetical protein